MEFADFVARSASRGQTVLVPNPAPGAGVVYRIRAAFGSAEPFCVELGGPGDDAEWALVKALKDSAEQKRPLIVENIDSCSLCVQDVLAVLAGASSPERPVVATFRKDLKNSVLEQGALWAGQNDPEFAELPEGLRERMRARKI